MKKNKGNYRIFRHLGLATQLGTTLLVSLALALFIGIYLDRCFDTSPFIMIGMGFFGIFSGLRSVVKMCSISLEDKEGQNKKEEVSD